MFNELYEKCKKLLNPYKLNEYCKISNNVCAIKTGNIIYTAFSIEGSMGIFYNSDIICLLKMIEDGHTFVDEIMVLDKFGNLLTPSHNALELITQINVKNSNAILYISKESSLYIHEIYPYDWKNLKKANFFNNFNIENTIYNLNRFLSAQERCYFNVLRELRNGKKISHWMWFIFPQLKILGVSDFDLYFGISGKDELCSYIKNNVLYNRYQECCNILENLETNSVVDIFGYIDAMKLKSSLTLFYLIDFENKIYLKLINKFFAGELCDRTLKFIER